MRTVKSKLFMVTIACVITTLVIIVGNFFSFDSLVQAAVVKAVLSPGASKVDLSYLGSKRIALFAICCHRIYAASAMIPLELSDRSRTAYLDAVQALTRLPDSKESIELLRSLIDGASLAEGDRTSVEENILILERRDGAPK